MSKNLSIITLLVIVLMVSSVGVYFRIHLSSFVKGDYFLGPDSYRQVRYIRQIASNGALPEVDLARHIPDGYKHTLQSTAFPWIIARSFQILNPFFPQFALNQMMALYPVAVTFLGCIVFFLLTYKHFGFLTASFATLALSTAPEFIGRTSAGYVDTDALIILLVFGAIFFYVISIYSTVYSRLLIYKLAYSGLLGILALIWPGVGLPAAIIYGCDFLIEIYKRPDRKRAITSLCGSLLYISFLLISGSVYHEKLVYFLGSFIPAFCMVLLCLKTLIKVGESRFVKYFKTGLIVVLLLSPYFLYQLWGIIITSFDSILFSFGMDPISTSIAELRPTDFAYWWERYRLLLPLGFVGFSVFVLQSCLPPGSSSRNLQRSSQVHLISIGLGLLCVILPRAFTPFFLRQTLWIRIIVLIAPVIWVGLHASYLFVKEGREKSLIFAIWFLISLTFNSTAYRYALFFAPVFVLMSSIFLVKVFEFFIPQLREDFRLNFLLVFTLIGWQLFVCDADLFKLVLAVFEGNPSSLISTRIRWIMNIGMSLLLFGFVLDRLIGAYDKLPIMRLCGFAAICVFCTLAYTGIYQLGIGQQGFVTAKHAPTFATYQRLGNFVSLIKEKTPPNAVIAADWDLGSFINEKGNRATIIDDQQRKEWIRSFYQRVIFGETVQEALDFLGSHNATELMLTTSNLQLLNRLWDQAYPNKPLNSPFVIPLNDRRTTTESLFEFSVQSTKPVSTFQRTPFTGTERLVKVIIDFESTGTALTISTPPKAVIETQAGSKILSFREIVAGNQQWYFPEADLPLAIFLDVSYSRFGISSHFVIVHKAFLLMEEAYKLNSVKLYLEGLGSNFEQLDLKQDGYAKLWSIHY